MCSRLLAGQLNVMRSLILSFIVAVVAFATVGQSLRLTARMSSSEFGRPPIDLRSDKFSMPSLGMRQAMLEVGSPDHYHPIDQKVDLLELRMAKMFGKENALFLPSEGMANLVAVMAHCGSRGSEVILGDKSSIYAHAQGGISQLGGVQTRTLPNRRDGTIPVEKLSESISTRNLDGDGVITELIAIENSHRAGGTVLPDGYTESVAYMAGKREVPVHMDGARIWNAAVFLRQPVSYVAAHADTVTASLHRGLGAPAGTCLMGGTDFIEKARRVKKVLG